VESLNTTIMAVLRRARGLRDEQMLLLKLKWATAHPVRSSRDLARFMSLPPVYLKSVKNRLVLDGTHLSIAAPELNLLRVFGVRYFFEASVERVLAGGVVGDVDDVEDLIRFLEARDPDVRPSTAQDATGGIRSAVSATFTSTKRAPSFPIPTRPDRDVGWQQDPADPLGHYAFGLGGGSSWAWHSDWKPTLLCVPSQKGLLAECPQRHRETTVRPARPYTRPSWSQIVMPSPSRR